MVETTEIDERPPSLRRGDQFNANIHGARGLFSFGILVFHVINSGLPTFAWLAVGPAQFVLAATEHCVELFFAISGFVMVGTLARARGPLQFLADRAIRIFPTLWVTAGSLFAFDLAVNYFSLKPSALPYDAFLIVTNFLALPGIFPLELIHPAAWSLSYEMCFYVVCALAWTQRRCWPRLWWLIVIPASAVLLAVFPRTLPIPLGILVALEYRSYFPQWARRLDWLYDFPAGYLLCFIVCWHAIQLLSGRPMMDTTLIQWCGDRRIVLAVIGCLALLVGMTGVAAGRGVLLCRMLRLPVFQWLGTVSYSLYLWHPILLGLMKRLLKNAHLVEHAGQASQLVFLIVAGGVSLAIAHLSQIWLERRTARWLKSLRPRAPLAGAGV